MLSVDGPTGSACTGANSTTCIVYNALGQRVEKYTGSAYTEIAYDAFGNQVGLHNQTTWVAHYIPFGGRPFVKYQSGKTYFLHPNHLGSTTSVTDETGATTQKTIYYPWGQAWATAGTVKDDRFASMDARDAETGNDPTLFRMYQPRLYRWLSPDPLAGDIMDPQSLNRYAYVGNNPVNFVDPLGLDPDCGNGVCFQTSPGGPVYVGPDGPCAPGPMPPMPPDGDSGGGGGGGTGGTVGGGTEVEVISEPDWARPTNEQIIADVLSRVNQPLPLDLADLIGIPSVDPTCGWGTCTGGAVPGNSIAPVLVAGAIALRTAPVWGPWAWRGALLAGMAITTYFSKGGPQNIPPSWVTDRPRAGETADAFAKRVCETKLKVTGVGCGNGPGSEFNKIKKWAQRWIDKHAKK